MATEDTATPDATSDSKKVTLEQRVADLERIAFNLAGETGYEGYRPQLVRVEDYLG